MRAPLGKMRTWWRSCCATTVQRCPYARHPATAAAAAATARAPVQAGQSPFVAIALQVWIAPGLGLGDDFIATLSSLSDDSSVVMLAILLVFAIAHSGLAFLRPYGACARAGRLVAGAAWPCFQSAYPHAPSCWLLVLPGHPSSVCGQGELQTSPALPLFVAVQARS